MVRKWASFAFGIALIAALGLTAAQTQRLKAPGAPLTFCHPCEPAPAAIKAAGISDAVLPIAFTLRGPGAEVPASLVCVSVVSSALRPILPPALRAFPPSWRRPPPAHS